MQKVFYFSCLSRAKIFSPVFVLLSRTDVTINVNQGLKTSERKKQNRRNEIGMSQMKNSAKSLSYDGFI